MVEKEYFSLYEDQWDKENLLNSIATEVGGMLNRDIFPQTLAEVIEGEISESIYNVYLFRKRDALGHDELDNVQADRQSIRLQTIHQIVEKLGDRQASDKIRRLHTVAYWEGLLSWRRENPS